MALTLAQIQKEVLQDAALNDLMAQHYADHLQQIVRAAPSIAALLDALKDEAKSDAWPLAQNINLRDLLGGFGGGKKATSAGGRAKTADLRPDQIKEIHEMYAADSDVTADEIKQRLGAELDGRRINKVLRELGAAIPHGGKKATPAKKTSKKK